MKVLNKPIDVITWTKENGSMIPFKFRITENDKTYSCKIQVQSSEEINSAEKYYIYTCQTEINNQTKMCEIRYSKDAMTWTLFKI